MTFLLLFLELFDLLSLAKIRSNLSTENFGKEIVYFEEIGSTNDEAKKLAPQGKPEGLLVLGAGQTEEVASITGGFHQKEWVFIVL